MRHSTVCKLLFFSLNYAPYREEKYVDINEISSAAQLGVAGVVIILAGLIKIPKLELNLWSFIVRALGKALNTELAAEVKKFHNDTDEKIDKLQSVIREEQDQSKWPEIFEKEGIADIGNTLDFINNFECTVVSDTTIPETSMQDVLKSLSIVNTANFRQINKYYLMAQENAKIYRKISKINKIMYDKPLTLIQSERQKQLVKKPNEVYKPTDNEKLISLLSGKYDEKTA